MLLTAILLAVLLPLHSFSVLSYAGLRDRVDAGENLRIAANRISGELRQARSATLVVGSAARSVTYLNQEGELGGFRYDSSDHELELQESGPSGSSWTPLSSDIRDLSFSYDSRIRLLSFTIKGGGQGKTLVLSSQIYLRN
jgi:hypothetical protein